MIRIRFLAPLAASILVGLSVAAPAVGRQATPPPAAQSDAQRIAQLTDEVGRMQSEIARLHKQVADLQAENKKLKDQVGDAADPGASAPGTPGTPGAPGKTPPAPGKPKFAPLLPDAMSSPEAVLKAFSDDYDAKVGSLPLANPGDREKALLEVGKWVRTAKRYRGRIDWTISITETTPDPLKGGGSITFQVVSPTDQRPYSDLHLTQTLFPGQFKVITDKADQKLWTLSGTYIAEPKVNKDLSEKADSSVFIGPFAEMSTTLMVQKLAPAGGTTAAP